MTEYNLRVLGEIWMPYGAVMATDVTIYAESDEEAEQKVDTATGDFSSVVDWQLETGSCIHVWRIVKTWKDVENEIRYWDCMEPMEEEE